MKGIIFPTGFGKSNVLKFDTENNQPTPIPHNNKLPLESFKKELIEARDMRKCESIEQRIIIDSITAKDNIHQEVGRNRAERRKRNKL